MKENYYTFSIIDIKSVDIKKTFISIIKDSFDKLNINYLLEEDNSIILKIYEDLNNDIKDILKAIVQEFDGEVSLFEGFRLYSDNELKKVKDYYLKYKFKNYMNIVDLIFKLENEELKELKKILFKELKKDNNYLQIINGMFESNLNVSKTATKVYMHRNSINNKLDIIEKETGMDIQKFKDAVAMFELIKTK